MLPRSTFFDGALWNWIFAGTCRRTATSSLPCQGPFAFGSTDGPIAWTNVTVLPRGVNAHADHANGTDLLERPDVRGGHAHLDELAPVALPRDG